MPIKINWDVSALTAPDGFQNAITDAVTLLNATFTNDVTVNIDVGWGKVAGQTLPSGVVGESQTAPSTSYSYSALKNCPCRPCQCVR